MAETLIEINDLTKIFRRDTFEIVALDHVNLNIQSGEFLALMGPSGSGKTTLMNIIAGIDHATSGKLLVAGEEIGRFTESQLASWRNRHIGYIFQTFNLIPVLTAFENVELPLFLTKLSAAERREHVMTALQLVNLKDRADHLPRQLSGGQEQRVAIARAIVADPTLILADEPTGDLDQKSAGEILTLLSYLQQDYKKTIIMVTHDPNASKHASHIQHLEKGKLLAK